LIAAFASCQTIILGDYGEIEERFLHFAGRQLRKSEAEEEASARFGRNDRFGLAGMRWRRENRGKTEMLKRQSQTIFLVDYGEIEERFLHCASRQLRRSEAEEKASARSGRNDRSGLAGMRWLNWEKIIEDSRIQ